MSFKSLVYILVITQLSSISGVHAQAGPDNASVKECLLNLGVGRAVRISALLFGV